MHVETAAGTVVVVGALFSLRFHDPWSNAAALLLSDNYVHSLMSSVQALRGLPLTRVPSTIPVTMHMGVRARGLGAAAPTLEQSHYLSGKR